MLHQTAIRSKPPMTPPKRNHRIIQAIAMCAAGTDQFARPLEQRNKLIRAANPKVNGGFEETEPACPSKIHRAI